MAGPKKGKSNTSLEDALKDFAKNNEPGTYADLKIEVVVSQGQGPGGQPTGRVTEYRVLP